MTIAVMVDGVWCDALGELAVAVGAANVALRDGFAGMAAEILAEPRLSLECVDLERTAERIGRRAIPGVGRGVLAPNAFHEDWTRIELTPHPGRRRPTFSTEAETFRALASLARMGHWERLFGSDSLLIARERGYGAVRYGCGAKRTPLRAAALFRCRTRTKVMWRHCPTRIGCDLRGAHDNRVLNRARVA